MAGYMFAVMIGWSAAVVLFVVFTRGSLRTPSGWLPIQSRWVGTIHCRECAEVERLFATDRYTNSRLFDLRALLTGAFWRFRWAFWPGSLTLSLGVLRANVFRRLGPMIEQSWFCRCWAMVPVGGYVDCLVQRERRLLRRNGFSSPSGDYRYLLGLSPGVPRLPIVREDIADHELVHMIQDAACNVFLRGRAHGLRPCSAGNVGFSLYRLLVVEPYAWVCGSTFLSAVLIGPLIVLIVWTISDRVA